MILSDLELKLVLNSDSDRLSQLREFEKQSSSILAQSFPTHPRVRELVMARSNHMDELLVKLWQSLGISKDIALIAVGGYGRGELHPYSDLDLLILHPPKTQNTDNEKLTEFITLLWDIGLKVGHSVRSVKQCCQLAKNDLTIVTNLMESRLLVGDLSLFQAMRKNTAPDKIWDAKRFFDAKVIEQKQRYKKYDGSSFDLEPNIKSSPGGLRDIHVIGWVAQRRYYPKSLFQLIQEQVITKKEYYTLVKCQLFLWRVRFALHLVSDKAEDRLLFDYQKNTAALMGFEDDQYSLGVEKLMKRYYRSVLIVRNIADILLQALEEKISLKNSELEIKNIEDGYRIVNGRIDAIDPNLFSIHPGELIRIFHLVARHSNIRGISASTLRSIRANRNKIHTKFRKNKEYQQLFIDFWHIKHSSSRAMFLMKRSGVLQEYLPAFGRITGQMQYDMFHSYTVDEHTLFLLRNLSEFSLLESKQPFPLCFQFMEKLDKPEIIYLAGLFHDIGKGRGGDHSEIGADEALKFCSNHGMPEADGQTVSWLVANHLLMSLTAQKRDTSDPKVIQAFADQVGSKNKLKLLYLLTVADIRATSQTLWNSWKDSLLKELAINTLNYLQQNDTLIAQQIEIEPWKIAQHQALERLLEKGFEQQQIERLWRPMGAAYFNKNPVRTISWHSQCILSKIENQPQNSTPNVVAIRERLDSGGSEIFVFSKDKTDLFATITATIAQQGLNVQGATIYTDNQGNCYDSFFTLNQDGSANISELEKTEIKNRILKNISAINHQPSTIQKRMPRQFKHFDVNTEIVFSNDEFSDYTRLDLTTLDQPGLLASIAQAFKRCDLRLHDARITTLGEKVEDSFIISHRDNTAINDTSERLNIEKTLKQQLLSN